MAGAKSPEGCFQSASASPRWSCWLPGRWTGSGFESASFTGALAAVSPVHVQYSHELRPYSMALFLLVLALWCTERYLAGAGLRSLFGSWLACLGCLYTLYFASVVVLVILAMLWSDRGASGGRAERALRWMPAFCGLLLASFLPWMALVASHLCRAIEAGAASWSWPLVAQRFDHLTIGGKEGDAPNSFLLLVGLVVVLGVVRALRDRRNWVVFFGSLVGSVGIEFLLLFADHWTNTRYDLNSWPFLVVLTALGVEQIAAFTGSKRERFAAPAVVVGVTAALCLLQLGGLRNYYEVGRPEWRRTAGAVHSLTYSDSRVWTTNEWTRICLSYYLNEEFPGAVEPMSLDGDLSRLTESASDEACTYVVDGGYPRNADLESFLQERSLLRIDRGGLGTRVYRVTEFDPDQDCIWNLSSAAAQERAGSVALEFGPDDRRFFVEGWSHPEVGPEGTGFVWALGTESFVALGGLPGAEYRLEIDLWPFQRPEVAQKVEITFNEILLGEFELRGDRQTIEVPIPRGAASRRENVLRFQFAYSTSPHVLDPRSDDRRELSAAFERLLLIRR